MKRFLIGLFLIAAVILGLSFYMGWFNLSVNKEKFKEDKDKAVEKVKDLGHQAKDKLSGSTEKDQRQATTPLQPTSTMPMGWPFDSTPNPK